MEQVDIEALVRMAYRQYQVDRLTPEMMLGVQKPAAPNASPTAGLASFLALGTRVDTSMRAATLFAGRMSPLSTPVDLLTLDEAVMKLPDMLVEWVSEDEVAIWTREDVQAAGGDLREGSPTMLALPGRDPVRVERVVATNLVIQFGRAGDRPDWCPEGVGVRAVRDSNGKPMMVDAKFGRACIVDYHPMPAMMMSRRAQYVVWRRALAALVEMLAGETEQFEATGPVASAAPWNDSQRVIHMPCTVGKRLN